MEPCHSFRWKYHKDSGTTRLVPTQSRCLHYYFYFIDEVYGLGYMRVPTWAPFALQVYINGHQYLARQLDKVGVDYELIENAFVSIADYDKVQQLSEGLRAEQLQQRLNRWVRRFCPVSCELPGEYYWSISQAEYATDIIFKRQVEFKPLYDNIVRTAVHAVGAEQVAMFLVRKLNGNYTDEVGNDFSTRVEGTRIRHHMGKASIKMYDKMGLMMRVECTTYDVPILSQCHGLCLRFRFAAT